MRQPDDARSWHFAFECVGNPPPVNDLMVGATGFEPATFRSRTGRSTRLSHAPTYMHLYGSVFSPLGSSFPNRVLRR